MTEFKVPRCECGHLVGDHQSSRAYGLRRPGYGVCLVDRCWCPEFKDAKYAKDAKDAK